MLMTSQAFAQKVVILELDGDTNHALRQQIEKATAKQEGIEIVSLETFKEAAANRKLKGGAAMTAVGVTRVGRGLAFDAAVSGEIIAGTYKVVIYDRTGETLWTKDLPLKKGLLSDDFAKKLSRAIAAASAQGASKVGPPSGDNSEPASSTPSTASTNTSSSSDNTMPEVDLSEGPSGPSRRPMSSSPSSTPVDESEPDPDAPSAPTHVSVPVFRLGFTGTTTWRSQCLRPGVTACKDYDTLDHPPEGVTINFGSSVPYLGFGLTGELFPLAFLHNRVAQGFGLLGGFQYGSSLTTIVEMTTQGSGPGKTVTSTDLAWNLQLAWRFHFNTGYGELKEGQEPAHQLGRPVSYVGLRGGLVGRMFDIDPSSMLPFPSSDRVSPTGIGFVAVGLDASIAISRYFRVEAGAQLYINPIPGPEQIVGYGNLNDDTGGASATGFAVEGGFAGDLWGPLGWTVKARYMGFNDRYYGQGQKWTVCNETQCGGAGEESFTSIHWGVTLAY